MRYLFTLVMLAVLAAPAYAAFEGPNSGLSMGGFQGPTGGAQADTVEKARNSRDDAPVALIGNIVERLAGSDDKYLFKDATGQIIVDIDHEIFAGRTVTPQTRVRLSGKVDKDMMEPIKIDVKVLEILK
ncbi:NirD/YgiW/YdeI family stress tolerance protein [uncultured Desulfovibrio sp.]|uniref:NirD/YgiW/YdeI family stress tolerance protein n=1 Tax=uncultured Desulfovibrio sp. TaxID=167968 RepID=UPI0003A846DB|nr:NirD/YgiW/YdeI family stress tolerance protein [uncultured Desulfovibrio sp.]